MYKCTDCSYTSLTWFGKCPKCGSFNILEVSEPNSMKSSKGKNRIILDDSIQLQSIAEALKEKQSLPRISSGLSEVDNVLSQFVEGGVYLFGGEPGVGKSTLALQILINLAQDKKMDKVAFITAEESKWQVSYRAKRIASGQSLDKIDIIATNDLLSALNLLKGHNYSLVVFDSMQAFFIQGSTGVAGGVSQVRDVVYEIVKFAKSTDITTIVIGQVTKEGVLAGPKLAEHIVDVVSYLERVDIGDIRLFRVIKNRYGEVGNLGFLRLTASGFQDAPGAYREWLDVGLINKPAVAFGIIMYGIRPLVIQVQALITDSSFSNPKRVAEGFSRSKLEVLIAIIDKHVKGVSLKNKDVFVKVIGGLNIKDSCVDLAVIAAILSAYYNKAFGKKAFIGEVGLLGDIKLCGFSKLYKKEAHKLGFSVVGRNKNIQNIASVLKLLKHS